VQLADDLPSEQARKLGERVHHYANERDDYILEKRVWTRLRARGIEG